MTCLSFRPVWAIGFRATQVFACDNLSPQRGEGEEHFAAMPIRRVTVTALAIRRHIDYKPGFRLQSDFGVRRLIKECEETIMAVPKKKTSPSRRGMRRSADALKQPTYVEDKDSGELRRPHHIDMKTGMYRGRQVFKVKSEA